MGFTNISDEDYAPNEALISGSPSYWSSSLAQVQYPSSTPLMFDAYSSAASHTYNAPGPIGFSGGGWYAAWRHNGGCNFGFVDGHAKVYTGVSVPCFEQAPDYNEVWGYSTQ